MRVWLLPLEGDWDLVGERGGRAGGRSEFEESEDEADREVEVEELFVGGGSKDCCRC